MPDNLNVFGTSALRAGLACAVQSGAAQAETLPAINEPEGVVDIVAWPIYIADTGLHLMHHKPGLGIKDPYELNEKRFAAALDLVRQQRAIVNRYWHDPFIQIDDFTNEGVVASSAWPFQVNLLPGKDQPIASAVPKEGATGWADNGK